jgi:hypothetical protein
MAQVRSLTKKGTIIKYNVLETIEEIWLQINYKKHQDNSFDEELLSHDFLLLTTKDGKVIIQKRFINSII